MRRLLSLVLGLASASALAAADGPALVFDAPASLAGEQRRLEELPPGALAEVARLVGHELDDTIRVALVSEGSTAADGAPDWLAGYAYGASGLIVLFPERVPHYPDSTLEELLLHEVAHVLIDRAAAHADVPRWFHEGVATVAGSAWDFRDRSRLTIAMLADREITLAAVEERFRAGGRGVSGAYAVAGAFARDLLRRHGKDVAARVLDRVAIGVPFDEAFRDVVGASPDEAAARFWQRHTFWYRWVPVLGSSTTLWVVITVLFVIAARRARRRQSERMETWAAEEEAARRATEGPWIH